MTSGRSIDVAAPAARAQETSTEGWPSGFTNFVYVMPDRSCTKPVPSSDVGPLRIANHAAMFYMGGRQ
jgi:hypothetical protein